MKRRILKRFVLPTVYVLIVIASFLSVSLINNYLLRDITNYDYSKSLMKDVTQATLKEDVEDNVIVKPYVDGEVEVTTYYYSKDDDKARQQNALIYYENTYMPSSGIIYASEKEFTVIASAPGIVCNITEDEILGNVIEISHNTNLTTFYYSLKDVAVSVGDNVTSGTVLGHGSVNKINSDKNSLLFEVYYQGKTIDPEKFYEMSLNELQ